MLAFGAVHFMPPRRETPGSPWLLFTALAALLSHERKGSALLQHDLDVLLSEKREGMRDT
jgi:hypothetical protein